MFLLVCVLMIDVDISLMSLLDCKFCPLSICSISFFVSAFVVNKRICGGVLMCR